MLQERDRARLIATYADDLIARGSVAPPETGAGPEPELAEMLDLARSLSEIEFETPPELTAELWQRARAHGYDAGRPAAPGVRGLPWRLFGAFAAYVRALGSWPVRHPAAAVMAAVVVGIAALLGTRASPTVSAAELLQASARAEQIRLARPGLVAHRAFTLEARRLPEATLLTKRHVELWFNPGARIKARRVFDERNRLLGGEWTNPDGSRVVYEAGKPPRNERALDPKPLTTDTIWRWEPSAADFTRLAGDVERVDARTTRDGFRLSFDDASGPIAQAELTLDKDHVPLAQIIVLREGGQAVEFRTARQVAEEIPHSEVSPASFEPEPELLPPPAASAPPASLMPVLTALALDGLELQATYRLQRLADCLAGPGELRRSPDEFRIRVDVVSEACREEAGRGLASLAESAGVAVDVSVAASKPGADKVKSSQAAPASNEVSDEELKTLPVYPVLYEFYARQALRERPGAAPDVDAAVRAPMRRFVLWARERSARAVAHGQELERLAKRWPPGTLKKLGLDSATMWQAMVRDQARGIGQASEVLLAQLQLVLSAPEQEDAQTTPAVHNLTEVRQAITDISVLAAANDATLRRLLAPPQPGTPASTAASDRLARDLRRTVRLAERFAEPWSLEP